MIESYSANISVGANEAIPFNSISYVKGECVTQLAPTTFALNKCGVYCVTCNVAPSASQTIELYKDGVALVQTATTSVAPGFTTLVPVDKDYKPCCPCSTPTLIKVVAANADTSMDANIVITKLR